MSEKLYNKFDTDFCKNIKNHEGLSDFNQVCRTLVDKYGVSPYFLKIMQDNGVFAGHDVMDILTPKVTSVIREESNIFTGRNNVRSAVRDFTKAANEDDYRKVA